MPDDFKYQLILEKINNLDRKIDSGFSALHMRYTEHEQEDKENFLEINRFVEKLDKLLLDESHGVVLELDRLKISEGRRSWLAKTAFVGVLASIGAHIWSLIKS